MSNETVVPSRIDQAFRNAVLAMAFDVVRLHPEAGETRHYPDGVIPEETCSICRHVAAAMDWLDAEQREYGPPIDVTDPSYLREHGGPA